MRLRIVHQLSLLVAGSVLLAALAMGGIVAWNLRAGFSDYLRVRDRQQLERFAQVVAERVDWQQPSMPERLPMRELMDEFLHREGLTPPPGWRPPPRGDRPPPPRGDRPPPTHGPGGEPHRGGPGPRPPARAEIGQRLQVVDPDGRHLGGPRFAPDGPGLLEQEVRAGGQVVARVRLLPSQQPAEVDAAFLRRQYAGLALAAGGTLALALLAALFAARSLGRPLQNLQQATRRIAQGEFGVAVPEQGSRELAGLIADVNRMAQRLSTLEGARRRWIAQIAHELRTPLSVLLGELEAVQDGARVADAALVAGLRDEVLQLVRLVGDLHLLSMADLGALPCSFEALDAAALLRRQAERMAPRLATAGLALAVEDGGPVQARWDAGRIGQLVGNLLENSLRYTDAPGQVRLAWAPSGEGRVTLRVDDSAPGVPPAMLDQLFEPLFRADAARQRGDRRDPGGSGSGLGLAICRAIVQAHGGHIAAQPGALGGLCVVAELPLAPPAAGAAP